MYSNNFIMDYNRFDYYRANPYYQEGYIPPIAHKNRKRPEFLTQLPQGDKHFDFLGRKHYSKGSNDSNIQNQHILESPQKYPFENRIALDKKYERNLNTIDIEGASSSTLMSPAVRNKWRARESIIRRQKELNYPVDELARFQASEEEKRRTVARNHFIKNHQVSQNYEKNYPTYEEKPEHFSQMRKYPSGNSEKNYQERQINRQMNSKPEQPYEKQSDRYLNYRLEKQKPSSRHMEKEMYKQWQKQQNYYPQQRQHYSPPQKQSSRQEEKNQFPRYQSIDSSGMKPESPRNGQPSKENYHQKQRAQQYKDLSNNRKQARKQNPTNLSSQGSIFLAGKNLIK